MLHYAGCGISEELVIIGFRFLKHIIIEENIEAYVHTVSAVISERLRHEACMNSVSFGN